MVNLMRKRRHPTSLKEQKGTPFLPVRQFQCPVHRLGRRPMHQRLPAATKPRRLYLLLLLSSTLVPHSLALILHLCQSEKELNDCSLVRKCTAGGSPPRHGGLSDATDSRCADSEQRSCRNSMVGFESFGLPHVHPDGPGCNSHPIYFIQRGPIRPRITVSEYGGRIIGIGSGKLD